MKTVKRFFATLIFSILYRPHLLMAQDGGITDENLEVLDSSYLEMPFMHNSVMNNTGTGKTIIIIVIALVVIASVAYFTLKKK